MDTDFKGAFLTTEAAVSYYNMKHITNNKIVVRPTLDRVLLMVNNEFKFRFSYFLSYFSLCAFTFENIHV